MRRERVRQAASAALRGGLERVAGVRPVLVPEYPLELKGRWGWSGPPLSGVAALLAQGAVAYEEWIEAVGDLRDWAHTIPRAPSGDPAEPHWENDWWGSLDALVQCAALRRRNPALYLEVGSGESTKFARRAIADFGLRTRIVSVDPFPRDGIGACCDELIARPFQVVGPELVGRLSAGDVVLFDGSHVALMNTDATVFLLELLPQVPPGVMVGVDDVFLPWDYPPTWTTRIYGEQYLLAAHLIGGGKGWEVRFPGWWLTHEPSSAARFESLWPAIENRFGRLAGSFWFDRV